MDSPRAKKRPWSSVPRGPKKQKRKHLNKRFYNSKAWRDTRKNYLLYLQKKLWDEAKEHKWSLDYTVLELTNYQSAYLMSLDYPVCEQCVKLFSLGVYNEVARGEELDHIESLNPEDALRSEGYGDPFSMDNLQLLCRRHHAKKSARDKK